MKAWARFAGGVGAVCALFILLFAQRSANAQSASADADGTHFHLAYEAPAGCPDRSAFLAAIHARTKRPQLAAEGESAIAFTVGVAPSAGRTAGLLEVREPGGAPQKRTVSGRTCADVAEALALVVALILDPDARTGPDPGVSDDAVLEEEPPRVESDGGSPEANRVTRVDRRLPPRRSSRTRVEVSAGAELGVRGGIAPTWGPAGGAFLDLELRKPRERFFRPSVRIGLGFAGASSDLPVGAQSYWLLTGSIRLCPIRAVFTRTLRLAPCGSLELGGYHGITSDVPNPASSMTGWIAPIAGASLEWAATQSFTLEVQGGAVFPLLRKRFYLAAPDTTIFEVPVVTGAVSVAGRLRFW